ncbi:MAG: translation initiation factor IF-2 [Holophagales bacterium]|jgi:translation initiation factor IF-2|nr:translation initiation factor IF-2 [Holophagales bacterium]
MLRINQLAKEIGVSNNAITEVIEKRLGIMGKTHSSNLTPDQVSFIRQHFDAAAKGVKEPTPLGVHPATAPVRVVKGTPSAPSIAEPETAPPPVLVKKPEPVEEPPVETEAPVQPESVITPIKPPLSAPTAPTAPATPRTIPPPISASSSDEGFSKIRVSTTPPPAPKPQEPARYIQLPQSQPHSHIPKGKHAAAHKKEKESAKSESGKPILQRQGQGGPKSHSQRHPKVHRSGMPQQEKTVLPMATNTGKGEVKHEAQTPLVPTRRPYIPPSISQLQPEQGFTKIKMADEPALPSKSQAPARYIQLPQARSGGGKTQSGGRSQQGRSGQTGRGGQGGRSGARSGGSSRQGAAGGRQGSGSLRQGAQAATANRASNLANIPAPDPGSAKGPGRSGQFTGKKKGDKRIRHDQDNEALELKLRQPRSRAQQVAAEFIEEEIGIVMLSEGVSVKELAEKCGRPAKDVVAKLLHRGIFATINQPLDTELAKEIAREFGYMADIVSFEEDLQILQEENVGATMGEKLPRPPVVTIMGHVDHGKTSLLDAIRKSRVAEGEAGGITQAIGAYHVDVKDPEGLDRHVVFIDTPGHEAFTKMRARGARVTDIVILVVAADDGVMPQTIEAINHTKAAEVPMVVAINKTDKPGADPDKVMQMLMSHGVQVETYGGDVPSVNVSAKAKTGLEELLETLLLVADLKDLRAVYNCPAAGSILEARLDRGRGPVATILVQQGTLKAGDIFVAGATMGRVRAMFDDRGARITEATPSAPVQILGFESVPVSGDNFQVVEDESKGRSIVTFRQEKAKAAAQAKQRVTLENLFSTLREGQTKELPLIVKADNHGSVESLLGSLERLSTDKVRVRIIHAAVGTVNKNDVLLAEASEATIIAFNVNSEREAEDLAREGGIDIRNHEIIYKVTEEITNAMVGLLDATEKEVIQGHAEIRQIFKVQRSSVAGSYILDGLVKRNFLVRVKRKSDVLFEGGIKTLRRFKDDASEVKMGFECGIQLDGFDALLEGDLLEFFIKEKVAATSLH